MPKDNPAEYAINPRSGQKAPEVIVYKEQPAQPTEAYNKGFNSNGMSYSHESPMKKSSY